MGLFCVCLGNISWERESCYESTGTAVGWGLPNCNIRLGKNDLLIHRKLHHVWYMVFSSFFSHIASKNH